MSHVTLYEPPLDDLASSHRDADNWRPIPPDKRILVTIRNIDRIGEVIPHRTNGLIVQVFRPADGLTFSVHLDNIVWPEKERKLPQEKASLTKERKTKPTKLQLLIASLLQEKQTLLENQDHA